MINYYIVDLETNGTAVNYHEVTQISAVRCSDLVQFNRFIKIKYPERSNKTALEVTNTTIEDLSRGKPAAEVIDDFESWLTSDGYNSEGRCIVGHNIVNFDRKFLHALWADNKKVFPANLWLDTIPYWKEWHVNTTGVKSRKSNLEFALTSLGVTPKGPSHSAKVDTQNNYVLWKKLSETNLKKSKFIKRIAQS